ncbi:hypothetical protein ACIGB6_02990 [Paeniglutamicibacter gangotriensis]|uniref:hypothetical protein n=1 Tax=Paeniglutamicibacter gangotriensis TaxID=254787 RepID=UPI0037C9E82B
MSSEVRELLAVIKLFCDRMTGPGKDFDKTLSLDEAADGTELMGKREAVNALLKP